MSSNGSVTGTDTTAAREKLRNERKLRLVAPEEEGNAIDFMPPGVYGFTYSPQSEGVPLFAKQTYQVFEVHKLADGSIHYIGFASEEEAATLDTADDAIDVTLYPEPHGMAQRMVSVPRSRILRSRPVSREQGNYLPLTLSAAR